MVVDANVVAAALIRPEGWTAREFERADVDWIAPRFLLEELEEHAAEYAVKAGCPVREWRRRTRTMAARVLLVGEEELRDASDSPEARRAEAVDPDDAVYMAALVASKADLLWTRDARLIKAFPGVAVMVVPRTLSR